MNERQRYDQYVGAMDQVRGEGRFIKGIEEQPHGDYAGFRGPLVPWCFSSVVL